MCAHSFGERHLPGRASLGSSLFLLDVGQQEGRQVAPTSSLDSALALIPQPQSWVSHSRTSLISDLLPACCLFGFWEWSLPALPSLGFALQGLHLGLSLENLLPEALLSKANGKSLESLCSMFLRYSLAGPARATTTELLGLLPVHHVACPPMPKPLCSSFCLSFPSGAKLPKEQKADSIPLDERAQGLFGLLRKPLTTSPGQ